MVGGSQNNCNGTVGVVMISRCTYPHDGLYHTTGPERYPTGSGSYDTAQTQRHTHSRVALE